MGHTLIHRRQRVAASGPTDLHSIPDSGTGEGVSHQPLPHQTTANRDGAPAVPDGTTNKNLVPESTNEAEERDPGNQGTERAGKASSTTSQDDRSPSRGAPRQRLTRWPLANTRRGGPGP